MGLLASLTFFAKKPSSTPQVIDHVFYKIVDAYEDDIHFILQCINTKAIFKMRIDEVVFDTDILHGLHPIQACYLGIEYARYLKCFPSKLGQQKSFAQAMLTAESRYGIYSLTHQDRRGWLGFVHIKTGKTHLMDPRDIALSEATLSEFDAIQAFHIGVFTGLKLHNTTDKRSFKKKPYLYLVKS